MMKRLLILLLALSFVVPVLCAKSKKTRAQVEWQEIQENSSYISELGYGKTVEEADQNALAALLRGISTSVESQYDKNVLMRSFNGDLTEENVVQIVVKTFSSISLDNTKRLIVKNEPDACVGRYVKTDEIQQIFAQRQEKIDLFMSYARQSLEELKIDDALRYYSWARALYLSMPRMNGGNTDNSLLDTKIDKYMDEIFDKLDVSFIKKDLNCADLRFTYDGRDVASLDFTYFDGRNWSNICNVKDGIGVAELPIDIEVRKLQLRYEYSYKSQAHIDEDVRPVISAQKAIYLPHAGADVSLTKRVPKAEVKKIMVQTSGIQQAASTMSFLDDSEYYSSAISKVVNSIRSGRYTEASEYFTAEGLDMYDRLIKFGRAKIIDDGNCKYYKFRDGVVARSVKMCFTMPGSSRKSFVEDVVFTFDSSQKIDCLAFAVGKDVFASVMGNKFWQETARMCIVEFLENYKTAYSLKRLDYLNGIFDDDAVIIVGRVVKAVHSSSLDDINLYTNNDVVIRNRLTKEQYIRNLENCFRSNEYVNVRFSNSDTTSTNFIRRYNKGGEVYGIQIRQDYYSTHYGDSGYLFLMVDLNDPQQPIIKVRTWQDTDVPINKLVSINNF